MDRSDYFSLLLRDSRQMCVQHDFGTLPRILLAQTAVSFLFRTIRWHSSTCTRNWVGWREGSLADHRSRKPLLSSVFASHRYANKMRKFYSKCVNIIEFAKDFCLDPRQRTDVQDQEEMRSRVGKEPESLPIPAGFSLPFPWIEALCINSLHCAFLWDCGSYGACALALVLWEAVLLFLVQPGLGAGGCRSRQVSAWGEVWFLSCFPSLD